MINLFITIKTFQIIVQFQLINKLFENKFYILMKKNLFSTIEIFNAKLFDINYQ